MLVPIYKEKENGINSYIEVHFKGGNINAELQIESEYKKWPNGILHPVNQNAEKYAIEFMFLEYKYWGQNKFMIKDKNLFSKGFAEHDPKIGKPTFLVLNINSKKLDYSSFADDPDDCVEIEIWINPNGDDCNCDGDEYYTGESYFEGNCDDGSSGGGSGGGGSGGSFGYGFGLGTGYGLGNSGGYSGPCGGFPCTSSGGYSGWSPINNNSTTTSPTYSSTVIFLGAILSLETNEKDWLSQNPSVALGIQEFLTESLNDEDPNTLLAYMDIFPPETISAAKASIHASMLNLIEGPYDQEHFESIKSDLPSPLNTNSFDPNFWLHFRISCAFIKLENPDWPNWKVYIHAMKETTHLMLDLAGLVPGWGEIADITNGVIYAIEGDGVNASLSFAAAIPIAGWASTATKLARKTVIALDGSRRSLKWIKDANGIIKFGDRGLLRKVLGLASGDPRIAHHMIPWEHGTKNIVQKAASGTDPFHLNELLNGIPLTSVQHNIGHNVYNQKIGQKLDELWNTAVSNNYNADQCAALVRNLANDIKAWISSHPNESINNIILP